MLRFLIFFDTASFCRNRQDYDFQFSTFEIDLKETGVDPNRGQISQMTPENQLNLNTEHQSRNHVPKAMQFSDVHSTLSCINRFQ